MKEKRRNGKARRNEEEIADSRRISPEALRGVSAIFLVAIAGFLVLAGTGIGGVTGSYLYEQLSWLLGFGYMLLPFSLILLAIAILRSFEKHFGIVQIASMTVFLLAALGLVNLIAPGRGGVIGSAGSDTIAREIETPGTIIILGSL